MTQRNWQRYSRKGEREGRSSLGSPEAQGGKREGHGHSVQWGQGYETGEKAMGPGG